MAAFLTHLVIGEQVWAALDHQQPAPNGLGTFLLGCLAPDMDKLCERLDQGTTHFVAKDDGNDYMWQRTRRFLDRQPDYLRAPFHILEPDEQAFVMGYLCHVSTDEITARFATVLKGQIAAAGMQLPDVNALLTAMDSRLWTLVGNPEVVDGALRIASIPVGTLIFAPYGCLHALHQSVLPQVQEGGGLQPYLNTVRRQWQWMRHGRMSDATDDPELEANLDAHRRQIETDLPASERLADTTEWEPFVDQAVAHSLQRIHALLALERWS